MNFDILKNLLDRFVEDGYAPGNSVLVYLNGNKVFDYACGYSDAESKTPMTGREYVFLYSCSKIATVTAALQLFEQGHFLLDDPLYEYIPEYREMCIKDKDGNIFPAQKNITIKNLFNMTAGFSYDTKLDYMKKAYTLTNGKMTTATVVKCLAEEPLLFEPGEQFAYSMCHDVLAYLVEVISGKKFSTYVKENIFEPLKMESCAYHLTPEIKKDMAVQYKFVPDGTVSEQDIVSAQACCSAKDGCFKNVGLNNSLIFGDEYDSGGAGIISRPHDYIKLASALSNFGTSYTGERILSPQTVDLMRTNTLDENQIKSYDWKSLSGYGYGLGVRTMLDRAKGGSLSNIGEFGWGGAAGSSVHIDPKIGLAVLYTKHTLSPREGYYMPRLRNCVYACL